MNKKAQGQFFGIILIPIIILSIAVAAVLGVILVKEFMSTIEIVDPDTFGLTNSNMEALVTIIDVIAPFVLVGTGIVFIVTSFTLQSHPILYVAGFFFIGIGVIVTAGVSNVLMEFNETSGQFTGTALPITMGMAAFMPHIVLAIGVIGAIAFYGKFGGGNGQA